MTAFIARYRPTRGFGKRPGAPGTSLPGAYRQQFFVSAREGLRVFLQQLRDRSDKDKVLVTPYICQAVRDVLEFLNLKIEYIDLCPRSLFQDNADLQNKLDGQTLAVILAPYFGIHSAKHLSIKPMLRDIVYILDHAQCVGCPFGTLEPDAVLLSYGLGKGTDFYGGSLVTRKTCCGWMENADVKTETLSYTILSTCRLAAQLTVLELPFLYRTLTSRIDAAVESNKGYRSAGEHALLCDWATRMVDHRLGRFLVSVPKARERSRALYGIEQFRPYLLDPEDIDFASSTFLRFPVLPPTRKDSLRLLRFFNARGIEMTSAEERPLPNETLPQFHAFNETILKLPYLGHLTSREFETLQTTVHDFFKS